MADVEETRTLSKPPRRHRKKKTNSTLSAEASTFSPPVATPPNNDGLSHNRIDNATREDNPSRGNGRGRGPRRRGNNMVRPDRSTVATPRDQLHAAQQFNAQIKAARPRARTLEDDTIEAESIMERIQIAMARNSYECAICCDIIKRHEEVYEDQNCWAVFHLGCIKEWAGRALKPLSGPSQDHWRCPSCQFKNTEMPGMYSCWCTKVIRPDVSKLAPHSCEQTCGKARSAMCPHPCSLQCHPGPCTPCNQLGPLQQCYCGKNKTQKRCVDTNYESGSWSCLENCGEIMPCDKHTCPRTCHPGLCGACEIVEIVSCYCGKDTKGIKCCDEGDSRTGFTDAGETVLGFYTCAKKCNREFDCGQHQCQKSCHTRARTETVKCPLSTDLITTCHCGKSTLADLDITRQKCTDPIPSCEQICNKPLACGHTCQGYCHSGTCAECAVEVNVPCQCGSSRVTSTCQDMQLGLQPSCDRVCRTQLSCMRHICSNVCCSGLTLAQSRVSRRPKGRQAAQQAARYEELEAEHLCTKQCGKSLTCGNHSCDALCHAGPCPTCLLASFDDLTCHCGRTAITAPVACGTRPPPCQYQCTRTPACGHPQVSHHCHLDDADCPRCPYLVSRLCMCGKSMVKNQPCWKTNTSCGQVCGTLLSCGTHTCQKRCHPAGACEETCTQTCGKLRSGCGHACAEVCHSSECPQDAAHPCQAKIQATCACGTIKMMVKCNAQSSDPATLPSRQLSCTDYCAIIERNKKLSSALGIAEDHKPVEATIYPDALLSYFKDNKIWCTSIESQFLAFFKSDARVRNFKPMRSDLREFIHALSEIWGFTSESMDEEPKRSVQIGKMRASSVPTKSLAQSLVTPRARQTEQAQLQQLQQKRSGAGYNAVLLSDLAHGLTKDELAPLLSGVSDKFDFDMDFMHGSSQASSSVTPVGEKADDEHDGKPDDDDDDENVRDKSSNIHDNQLSNVAVYRDDDDDVRVLLRPTPPTASGAWTTTSASSHPPLTTTGMDAALVSLRKDIRTRVSGVCGRVELCWVGRAGAVEYTDTTPRRSGALGPGATIGAGAGAGAGVGVGAAVGGWVSVPGVEGRVTGPNARKSKVVSSPANPFAALSRLDSKE